MQALAAVELALEGEGVGLQLGDGGVLSGDRLLLPVAVGPHVARGADRLGRGAGGQQRRDEERAPVHSATVESATKVVSVTPGTKLRTVATGFCSTSAITPVVAAAITTPSTSA